MKGEEKMAKRSTIESGARKTLSDITNYEPRLVDFPDKYKGPHLPLPSTTAGSDSSVTRLLKENAALVKLIEERNKIIELSGNELRILRMTIQKLQLQNWNLAQSNSQMLAELNSGKDKLKALQHELMCKEALLKVKKSVQQGNACQSNGLQEAEKAVLNCSRAAEISTKLGNRSTRISARSKSMGASTMQRQEELENVENKRRCLRRQSARFKSQEEEAVENLFEIEDAKFPVTKPPDNSVQEVGLVPSSSSVREDENSAPRNGRQALQRSSIGRPSRSAAAKVKTYKEIPLNVKMRRAE